MVMGGQGGHCGGRLVLGQENVGPGVSPVVILTSHPLKRLSWHHRGGSDLLRCGGFYTASDPNKEDIR